MTNFTKESELLAPLQTFDRDAFVGDERVPQDICNFVLALALIYNDCKDGIFSNMILTDSKPKGQFELSRGWGAYNGLKLHYIRLHVALIHELLQLIEDNQQILKHPFFNSVIQKLSKQARIMGCFGKCGATKTNAKFLEQVASNDSQQSIVPLRPERAV